MIYVVLDLDECIGSWGITSLFFEIMVQTIDKGKYPFSQSDIKYISNHLIQHCIRPGIVPFLKMLYRQKPNIRVVLFTNHENPDFLPFLRNCLNYIVCGKVNVTKGVSLFDEWIYRSDPRRSTTPFKQLEDVIRICNDNMETSKIIMYDDTVKKVKTNHPELHTIVEVPEYDYEITFDMMADVWKHVVKLPIHHLEEILQDPDNEEDLSYISENPMSSKEKSQEITLVNEFFFKRFLEIAI